MKFCLTLLFVLATQITFAKSCPVAFLVFKNGQNAEMGSAGIQVIIKEIRAVFLDFNVVKLEGTYELARYDYALTYSIDTNRRTIGMNFRDILLNKVLASHTVSYTSFATPESATFALAKELKSKMDQQSLTACQE